jgi:hypothetical protein
MDEYFVVSKQEKNVLTFMDLSHEYFWVVVYIFKKL